MPFALDSHSSWIESRPCKRRRLAATVDMARAEDSSSNKNENANYDQDQDQDHLYDYYYEYNYDYDSSEYPHHHGQGKEMLDLACRQRQRQLSGQAIRTSDREELIQCIKRGQRPTWVPKPNLKALCTETNANAEPAKELPNEPEPAKDLKLKEAPALPEPIPRPPSALHAGDFDANPELYDDLPSPFSPLPQPSPHQRPRTTSLGSSLSSSFVMRVPTSPLAHASSSPASERAESLSDKAARRRTLPTPASLQIHSPSTPPSLGHSRAVASVASYGHQSRRSLTSFTYQPASSSQTIFPSRQRRFSQAADASPRNRTSMIGSFEESILRGRMSTPPSKPLDFVAQIGVLGKADCPARLKCPAHVSVPFPAVFYNYASSMNMRTLSDDSPSPYVGTIDLNANLKPVEMPVRRRRRTEPNDPDALLAQITGPANTSIGRALAAREAHKDDEFGRPSGPSSIGGAYRVPQQGQVQVVIKNPNKTAVKLFLIPYDLGGMTAGSKTFVRQRSLSSGPVVEKALSMDPERTVLDPLSGKYILRYLIHLKFCCLGKGRFYLYDNIRVVFANRVPEGKERLRNEIQLPEPKYSSFVPGASSRRQSRASTSASASPSLGAASDASFPSLDELHRQAAVPLARALPPSRPGSSRTTSSSTTGNTGSTSQSGRPQSPELYGFDRASTSQRASPLPMPLPSLGQTLSRTSSPTPAASGDGLLSRKLRELSRQQSKDE